jgi:hypothetical protein
MIIPNGQIEFDRLGGEKVVDFEPIFGEYYNYYMVYSGGAFCDEGFWSNMRLGHQFDTEWFDGIIFNSSTNSYFSIRRKDDKEEVFLTKYEADSLEIVQTIQLDNTKGLFVGVDNEIDGDNIIVTTLEKQYIIDPKSMTVSKTYLTENYRSNFPGIFDKIEVINGLLFLWISDNITIYNLESTKQIFNFSEDVSQFHIASDGSMFIINNSIYEINNEVVNQRLMFPGNPNVISCSFDFLNNKLYYSDGRNDFVEVMDLVTGVVSELAIPGSYWQIKLLEYTNILYLYSYGKIVLYNINTKEQKSIKVYESHTSGDNYYYLNGRIIRSIGFYMDFQ